MPEEFKNPFELVNNTETEPVVNAEAKTILGNDGVIIDPNEEPVVKSEEPVEAVEVEKENLPPAPPPKTARQMILEEYGGLESNVPINSPYWSMK